MKSEMISYWDDRINSIYPFGPDDVEPNLYGDFDLPNGGVLRIFVAEATSWCLVVTPPSPKLNRFEVAKFCHANCIEERFEEIWSVLDVNYDS